ncbi:hypothetical protein HMPREF1374_01619 [Enterococcus faecium P1190]|nr:hypothetical protein HMPREF1374_01619 [Enterococcus faecium P1190]
MPIRREESEWIIALKNDRTKKAFATNKWSQKLLFFTITSA